MLKRGNIALMSAAVPGFLAYTGWFDVVTPAAKVLFLALLGFSAVSFLLALFEDDPAAVETMTVKSTPAAKVLALDEAQLIRVAP